MFNLLIFIFLYFIHLFMFIQCFVFIYSFLIHLHVINDFICFKYEVYDQDYVHTNLHRDMGTHQTCKRC